MPFYMKRQLYCINIRSSEYTSAATKRLVGLRAYSAETGQLFKAKLDTCDVAAQGTGVVFTTEGIVKLANAEQMEAWASWLFMGSTMTSRWTLRTIGRFCRFRGGQFMVGSWSGKRPNARTF
jgi:hypothetical protein